MLFMKKKITMVAPQEALPGRGIPMPVEDQHWVLKTPMRGPWPGMQQLLVGMGCFWGAERRFWQQPGVHMTAVGYAAGYTPNPTYEEVCANKTGHNEVVLVVYDPQQTDLERLLRLFWEAHNPTQGMQQGNDVGTQYRSGIYLAHEAELALALATRDAYQQRLSGAGLGTITTEILPMPPFYYAEAYHQQYLAKNPGGYCGLGGTGVVF
ncbi:peptide methionine sulfoxide reductase [Magnetococcus marinus MC-1]|uniref:Peptide methionine sulfoxide reductase MsrA n=1 Tax=Magnetococcus marinus (strain ATCC BAA-1437 / JCM 17883 / MC-1) TaxID=156889 RepID=A0LA02_MAGMM|nr:peptide-methionine (S)-S-oxide reductase MsrA [Magnetococcus marinus]ABK44795.1 peptide methionine sulfoxide reductase [Magnetococcus marinus MC-1]